MDQFFRLLVDLALWHYCLSLCLRKSVQEPLKERFEGMLEDEIPPTLFFFGMLLIFSSVEGVKGIKESRLPYAFLEHTWVTVMNRRRIRKKP